MTLPGFAFVTLPPPKRSRRRIIPVAVAIIVAPFLLFGVMEENRSIRVIVAERAQADNVRIDPDHLPVALVEYPITVIGETSSGQQVSCTILALHDGERPVCVLPPSPVPVSDQPGRPHPKVGVAPPTSAVAPSPTPSPRGRNDPPVPRTPPATVPPTPVVTPDDDDRGGPSVDDDRGGPSVDDHRGGHSADDDRGGHSADDNQDDARRRLSPGAIVRADPGRPDGVNRDETEVKAETRVKGDDKEKGHDKEKGLDKENGHHDEVKLAGKLDRGA